MAKALNPSSNWKALQKKLGTNDNSVSTGSRATKRRKLDGDTGVLYTKPQEKAIELPRGKPVEDDKSRTTRVSVAGPSTNLGDMILHCNEDSLSESQRKPGKYLAVDCEMVGVGPAGEESSLARVSMVNYHGSVQLDIFVKQREQVTDYRTAVSGIHPHNVSSSSTAVTFAEAQKRVADLIKDRVLIGHAIENDLKALLLSHPRTLVRDTQRLAKKSRLLGGSRWPGLKKLIQKEFDVMIQAGQHDSVTDARATMALFRKYREEWEKSQRPIIRKVSKTKSLSKVKSKSSTTAQDEGDEEWEDEEEDSLEIKPHQKSAASSTLEKRGKKRKHTIEELESHPGAGVKGFSSGLTTVVRRRDSSRAKGSGGRTMTKKTTKSAWWTTIGPGGTGAGKAAGSKGGIKLKLGT